MGELSRVSSGGKCCRGRLAARAGLERAPKGRSRAQSGLSWTRIGLSKGPVGLGEVGEGSDRGGAALNIFLT